MVGLCSRLRDRRRPTLPRVQVRVLGGAAIVGADGRAVTGLDRKARELLTILALRAPAGVSLDELQQLLWDEPPPTAARTIQAHLSRLRGALRSATVDGTIERRGRDQYHLVLPADGRDLDVVATARAQAREALGEGRPDAAAALLAEARALWAGEPELPPTIAATALAQAWRQERHQLTVEHLAALTEGSQPGRALGELELLTAADPLAEGLWACRVGPWPAAADRPTRCGLRRRLAVPSWRSASNRARRCGPPRPTRWRPAGWTAPPPHSLRNRSLLQVSPSRTPEARADTPPTRRSGSTATRASAPTWSS